MLVNTFDPLTGFALSSTTVPAGTSLRSSPAGDTTVISDGFNNVMTFFIFAATKSNLLGIELGVDVVSVTGLVTNE